MVVVVGGWVGGWAGGGAGLEGFPSTKYNI